MKKLLPLAVVLALSACNSKTALDPFMEKNCGVKRDKIDCSEDFGKFFDELTLNYNENNIALLEKNAINTEMLFSSAFQYGYGDSLNFYNGLFGNDFKRLQIHIDNDVVKVDNNTYKVYGTSRRNKVCRKFSGEIKIDNIKQGTPIDGCDQPQGCISATYRLAEDKTTENAGEFTGRYISKINIGAHNCDFQTEFDTKASANNQDKIWLNTDDLVTNGYWNRQFVGQWTPYDGGQPKKAIWGDCRLAYSFDLDCGEADMSINEKYLDDEWTEFMKQKDPNTREKIEQWW